MQRSDFAISWRLSLSLSLIIGLMVFPFQPTLAEEPVAYGCFPEPITLEEAEALDFPGPIHAILCPDDPPACTVPPVAPQVTAVHKYDTLEQASDEAKLLAQIPNDGGTAFQFAIWEAWRLDSTWQMAWQFDSYDSMRYPQAGSARFGATGLMPGKTYRFRVAFCRRPAGLNMVGCTCWSDYSSNWTTPGDFPSLPFVTPRQDPDDPAEDTREFEDHFERRSTNPEKVRGTGNHPDVAGISGPGDGIGPDDVYSDSPPFGTAGTGVQILEGLTASGYVLLPQAAAVAYLGSEASHPRTWGEIEFSTLSTVAEHNCNGERNYNMDIEARVIEASCLSPLTGTCGFYYAVKIVNEPDFGGCQEPPLADANPVFRFFRGDNGQPVPLSDGNGVSDFHLADISGCDPAGLLTGSDKKAILRIEVRDNSDDKPEITASVAWDCDSGDCTKVCSKTFVDLSIPNGHPLKGAEGRWIFTGHHWDHAVFTFRVGSVPE